MSVRRTVMLLVVLLLAGCSTGRSATDGTQVFKAILQDPIPAGVSHIESTGAFAGEGYSGHDLYLRFHVTDAYLAELIAFRRLVPADCGSDFVRGNLTLSMGLETDILDWNPFNGDPDTQCYTTGRSYTNTWSRGARAVMAYQPRTGLVYYNEVGL